MRGDNLLPSETAVRNAIEGLKKSPGTFQRLCEIYAQLRYPDRFSRIVPYGRRADDVTIKGWPDAYAPVDGGVEALEVTHSTDSARHLRDDRERMKKFEGKAIKGFLFIAWSKTPRSDILDETENGLAELLDIPRSKITLVYAEELVKDLATDGRFARVLSSVLELTTYPTPFWPVDVATHLFGKEGDPGLSAPSLFEYRSGHVHRPKRAGTVEERLRDVGWVVVRGRGASGKTSLALQITQGSDYSVSLLEDDGTESRYSKAYYLNLGIGEGDQGAVDLPAACKVMTEFGDECVLFILDNIHLNESDAAQLFNHWEYNSRGSRLLMLGREVKRAPNVRGTAEPLDEERFKNNTVILKIKKEDLAGVYERLAKRKTKYKAAIQEPPDDFLERWLKLFGWSLVVFSAAVVNKLESLVVGEWELTPDDAKRIVRRLYLNPLEQKPAEKNNLLRIAAMAKWEFDTPEEALENEGGPVKHAIDSGIVYRVTVGYTNFVRYHLIHPGLGELILAAAGVNPVDEEGLLLDIVRKDPYAGLLLGNRLESVGEEGKAKTVLGAIVNDPKSFTTAILSNNLKFTPLNLLRFERFGLLSAEKADGYFLNNKSDLIKAAFNSHLGHFALFLRFAKRKGMKETYNYVIENFRKEDEAGELIYKDWFVEKALLTPLGQYKAFFNWAENELFDVFGSVAAALNEENEEGELKYKKRFIEKVLYTSLNDLTAFLKYAEIGLHNVFESVTEALNGKDEEGKLIYKDWFVEKALYTPLNDLTAFLKYAETGLKSVFRSVTDTLDEKNEYNELIYKEKLITKFFDASVEHCTYFLQFADVYMPNVFGSLAGTLNSAEYRDHFVKKFSKTRLGNLYGFLRYVENDVETADLGALITAIEITEWEKMRDSLGVDKLDGIKSFAQIVGRYGRFDLVEAPARNIIQKTRSREQHSKLLALQHISYTLKFGRGVGDEEMTRFLDLFATGDWLDQQYESPKAKPCSIAGFLYSVWAYNGEKILERFLTNTLDSRIISELRELDEKETAESFSWKTQLLGIAALIGLFETGNAVKALSQTLIDKALDYPTPLNELDYFGSIQVQFWLGLRELARLFPGRLSVPVQAGDKILELGGEALENLEAETEVENKPEIPRFKVLYTDMIKWLERCKAEGWQLVAAPRIRITCI